MALKDWGKSFSGAGGAGEAAANRGSRLAHYASKPFRWMADVSGKFVWNRTKDVVDVAGHTGAGATGFLWGLARSKTGKRVGIAALIVGGLATAGLLIGKSRSPKNDEPVIGDASALAGAPGLDPTASGPTQNMPEGYWAAKTDRSAAPQAQGR